MRNRQSSRRQTRRATLRGIAIIEAMVGMLIFAFGVLGIVGLQGTMAKAQSGAKYRAEAVNLGYELIGRMWADAPANLPLYAGGACINHAPCAAWDGKLKRMLPGAETEVAWDPVNSEVHVLITWSRPGEGSSRYDLRAVIG